MKFILKYGIGIYLIITLLFKLSFLVPHLIVNIGYYILMAFGVILIPFYINVIFGKKSISVFWVFHAVNFLNLMYVLLFDLKNMDSWLYFLTKFSTFNLIILGLIYNYDFYKNFFIKYFKYIILMMLVAGSLFGGIQIDHASRLSVGFNPNDVGLFGLMGLFAVITFNKEWVRSKTDIALVTVFFIFALLSGSKATLLGIGLVGFMNYGATLKSMILAGVAIAGIVVISNFGYITSIDRLASKEGAFDTREEVYKNGMLTFEDSMVFGHGLDKYGWSNPKYFAVPEDALGPHNTYIAIGIMYGLFFGIIFLIILSVFLFQKKNLKKADEFHKFSYYFLCLIMVIGFFETLIVGVNETVSLLFWFFIGVSAFANYSNSKLLNAKNII